MSARIACGGFGCGHAIREMVRDVKVGLVERQGFDDRRELREYGVNLLRDRAVNLEARGCENEVRAFAQGRHGRHGGMHAEFARLIARGGDHATFAAIADRQRFSAQRGRVALLDRGEEGVHVDMNDFSHTLGRIGSQRRPDLAFPGVRRRVHEGVPVETTKAVEDIDRT